MPAMRMPLPGIRPLTAQQRSATNRGQSAMQATRPVRAPSRVTIPGSGGFGAKTQQAAVARAPVPMPGAGKGSAPGMPMPMPMPAQQPMFNLPNPVQTPPSVSSTTMTQPVGYQNPIGQYQTPAPAQNPPIAEGNFGTIQPTPYPVSGIAMPTPNPVPVAPPPNLPGPQQMDTGTGSPSVVNPFSQVPIGEQYNTTLGAPSGGMNNLQGLYGLGRTNPLSAMGGMGGPPQMTFQDYINQGNTPEQAQQMMSQFGPK